MTWNNRKALGTAGDRKRKAPASEELGPVPKQARRRKAASDGPRTPEKAPPARAGSPLNMSPGYGYQTSGRLQEALLLLQR